MAKIKPKTSGVNVDDVTEMYTEDSATTETIQTEGVENPVADNTVKEDDIVVNTDIVQKSAVKTVRILPAVNHNCSIGGIRYSLKKGVCQNVPEEVKVILNKSGLLSPL